MPEAGDRCVPTNPPKKSTHPDGGEGVYNTKLDYYIELFVFIKTLLELNVRDQVREADAAHTLCYLMLAAGLRDRRGHGRPRAVTEISTYKNPILFSTLQEKSFH